MSCVWQMCMALLHICICYLHIFPSLLTTVHPISPPPFPLAAWRGLERASSPGTAKGQGEADLDPGEGGEPSGGHAGAIPGMEGLGWGQSCEFFFLSILNTFLVCLWPLKRMETLLTTVKLAFLGWEFRSYLAILFNFCQSCIGFQIDNILK